jgi:hypothetical protein
MGYFDDLEKSIVHYLKKNEVKNKSKNKKKAKTNKFFRKVECWNCNAYFHVVVLTKYHGIFEEDLEKLSDAFEMVHAYYEGCCYRLENEEPKEEYKEIVQIAKEIYDALENQKVK